MTTLPIRVVMVEDDLWVARVNRDLLEQDRDVQVIGIAGTCAEAGRLVESLRPDLVLLDVYPASTCCKAGGHRAT